MTHNRIRKRNGHHVEARVVHNVTPRPVLSRFERKVALLAAGAMVHADDDALALLYEVAPKVRAEVMVEALRYTRMAHPTVRSQASIDGICREIREYLRSEKVVIGAHHDDA